jgi:hypothetical protein
MDKIRTTLNQSNDYKDSSASVKPILGSHGNFKRFQNDLPKL